METPGSDPLDHRPRHHASRRPPDGRRSNRHLVRPIPRGEQFLSKCAEHADAIRASVCEAPDATLEEHRRRLGLDLGISTLWRAMRALGLTLKSREGRADVAEGRTRWRRLVFIDETWTKTNMTRTCGRAPSGVRLVAAAPHGHWKTTTFVAALRTDGLTAPLVVGGPINGETFEAYIRQFVVPTLVPGDSVVMDNLAAHKRAGVREAIEAVGCRLLFLPPYSPDLNPIEQAFAQLKALLRKAGERSFEGLCNRLGLLVDEFTPRRPARPGVPSRSSADPPRPPPLDARPGRPGHRPRSILVELSEDSPKFQGFPALTEPRTITIGARIS